MEEVPLLPLPEMAELVRPRPWSRSDTNPLSRKIRVTYSGTSLQAKCEDCLHVTKDYLEGLTERAAPVAFPAKFRRIHGREQILICDGHQAMRAGEERLWEIERSSR